MSSTRRALKPQFHLLQVASKLLFQLIIVSNFELSSYRIYACLRIGFVLLAKADSEVFS